MNYLIITFDGFGDGVMYYPIFTEIGKEMPKSSFFYTSNIFFSDDVIKNKIKLPPNFIPAKDSFRKFPKDCWQEVKTFIKNNNIDAVINLRTIGRRFEKDYYDFKDCLISENNGVAFWDDEILKDEERTNINIRNIISKIVEKATGKKLSGDVPNLKELFLKTENPDRILINMHSRGLFKSWEPDKWAQLIQFLVTFGKKVDIYKGSGDEKLYTKNILEKMSPLIRNKLTISQATNLYELGSLLSNTFLVISVDSGIIHLADALGVNSLGIYLTTSPLMWGGITKKFNYVCSSHMSMCKNFYPSFGMCINNKRKCEEISGEKDDINTESVLQKVNEIYNEKKN